MQIVVTYSSKTGFTRTFAEWIATELDATLVETSDLSPQQISDADVVIHGGTLRAAGVLGLRRFLRHWPLLSSKHVVLWQTGANPGRSDTVEQVGRRYLTDEQMDRTTRFYLRGGFDVSRLRGLDRILMRVVVGVLRRKKNPSDDDLGMLAMYDESQVELDREAITPLVDHVKSLKGAAREDHAPGEFA